MKSKKQIYEDVKELVEAQDKKNYLAYYKIFLDNSERTDIPTEEKEAIINQAYKTYKRKEEQLEEILDLAYIDLMESSNRAII
jgi:hypothetical protein|nr:MAG TPA: hypothetical protein [Caudoviricetes sp.]